MASGDTKTEAMLNVLGNGGSGDEFRGCCNTKTQQYILDAIDRINNIQPGGSYTAGDGITIANDEISVDLAQATGDSTTKVMSQKAVTDALASAGGAVKTLTTADYNYPTDNPTRVALWSLPDGLYYKPTGVLASASTTKTLSNSVCYFIIIRHDDSSQLNPKTYVTFIGGDFGGADNYYSLGVEQECTNTNSGSRISYSSALNNYSVVNNLLTTSAVVPLSANQGKVLKDLIDSLAIKNAGAPTTSTVGTVGQLLEDTTNGKLYQCTAVSGNTYTWTEVGAGGSITPVQTTGTSTTDVMSQNATTSMIFADPAIKERIRIGSGSDTDSGRAVVIGSNATSYSSNSGVAIGYGSSASSAEASTAIGSGASASNYRGSVALGANARTNSIGEMNIGTTVTNYGYNSSNYRLLTGLYDPQNAHDAATKGYVDTLVGDIASALNAINNGTGA